MGIGHETDLTRQSDIREQRWTIFVLTNGASTEVTYFEGIRRSNLIGNNRKMIVRFHNSSPTDLALRTAELRDYSEYDEAWAVCDVDEFDVGPAIVISAAKDVNLALSQPCFEVWLILHKSPQCPGLNSADQACELLQRHVNDWDKSELRFTDFVDGIGLATARARQLGEPPEANPSTAVWRLAVSLGLGDDSSPRPVRRKLP